MRQLLFITLMLTPALVGVLVFGVEILNAHRINRGLFLGETSIGGMSPNDAQQRIAAHADEFLKTPFTLQYESFTTVLTPEKLGLTVNLKATFAQAWMHGREGRIVPDLRAQVGTFLSGKTIAPVITFDIERFEQTLDMTLQPLDDPAQHATLRWDSRTKTFAAIPERNGEVVDREAIRAALVAHAATLTTPRSAVALSLVSDHPITTTQELPDAQARVNALLARTPLTLHAGDSTITVTREQAAPWFLFIERLEDERRWLDIDIEETTVRDFLARDVTPNVNREPVDAKFKFANGRVTTFALAKDGQALDMEMSVNLLKQALLTDLSSDAAQPTLTFPVAITKPTIGNDAANELGVRELIAVGETDFIGSPPNRVHNIKVGASRFNGVLIKPGEEFSFNRILGAVGPQTGYKPELVIKQGKTTPEYGGGLCQVSTTVFRAAVNAGLGITERRNHAYAVRYYGTPGFDATIYPPRPDFKFINSTPGHILIQTAVVGAKLRFEFYGTNDGRKVEIIGPYVYDKKPDGSVKATLTMRVTFADGSTKEQTFRSAYKSPKLYPIERRNPLE